MATQDYEQHPLAIDLMPGGMTPEEFDSFCEDVAERGILYPITIYEGKVLDGWHRYRASKRTGKPFRTMTYEGDDPAAYIGACNILRRKLSSLQRALFAARVHLKNGTPQIQVCKRYSISKAVLAMVLKAIESRNAMLIQRIAGDGEFTRGMLREELEDMNLVHKDYGRSRQVDTSEEAEVKFNAAKLPDQSRPVANSVFDLAKEVAGKEDIEEEPEVPSVPAIGKKPTHPERRAKPTAAQVAGEAFAELMMDEKEAFIRNNWHAIQPIAVRLGLLVAGKLKAVA